MLPYAAGEAGFFGRFAATCRRGRQASRLAAGFVVRQHALHLENAAREGAIGQTSRQPVPALDFSEQNVHRASRYLRALSGRTPLQKAHDLRRQNSFEPALQMYRDVLFRWPAMEEANFGMAQAFLAWGKKYVDTEKMTQPSRNFAKRRPWRPNGSKQIISVANFCTMEAISPARYLSCRQAPIGFSLVNEDHSSTMIRSFC